MERSSASGDEEGRPGRPRRVLENLRRSVRSVKCLGLVLSAGFAQRRILVAMGPPATGCQRRRRGELRSIEVVFPEPGSRVSFFQRRKETRRRLVIWRVQASPDVVRSLGSSARMLRRSRHRGRSLLVTDRPGRSPLPDKQYAQSKVRSFSNRAKASRTSCPHRPHRTTIDSRPSTFLTRAHLGSTRCWRGPDSRPPFATNRDSRGFLVRGARIRKCLLPASGAKMH